MKIVFPLAIAMGLAACTVRPVTPADAVTRFADRETCPIDRVQVTETGSTDPNDLARRDAPIPDDIDKDPARRSMWLGARTSEWSSRTDIHVYHVEGCDIVADVVCSRPRAEGRHNYVSCRTLERHDLAFEEQMRKIRQDTDRMLNDVCTRTPTSCQHSRSP